MTTKKQYTHVSGARNRAFQSQKSSNKNQEPINETLKNANTTPFNKTPNK